MREEIGRYECIGDSGRHYIVVEYQNFLRVHPVSGSAQDVRTTKECFLSDGRDVNYIDENTFQIVLTDELIRKIS